MKQNAPRPSSALQIASTPRAANRPENRRALLALAPKVALALELAPALEQEPALALEAPWGAWRNAAPTAPPLRQALQAVRPQQPDHASTFGARGEDAQVPCRWSKGYDGLLHPQLPPPCRKTSQLNRTPQR